MKSTCVISAGVATLLAAGAAAGEVGVGSRGGLSVPKLHGGGNEISEGYESILAPNVGLAGELRWNNTWSVLLEVQYSVQGGERDEVQPVTGSLPELPPMPPGRYIYADYSSKSVLEYLEIPLMLRWRYSLSDRVGLYAQGGPYVGFLLAAEQQTRGTSALFVDKNGLPLAINGRPLPPVSFDRDTDVKDDLNAFNWGLTAGVGVEYKVADGHWLHFDIRGEYGLRYVQKDDRNGESHTGCASFLLGYQYRFEP